MATVVPHLQKSFKLVLKDGIPQATVETVGAAQLLRCCPLCGSVHQIMAAPSDETFTPLCQTHPVLYKTERAAWQKLHPDVVAFTALYLVSKIA